VAQTLNISVNLIFVNSIKDEVFSDFLSYNRFNIILCAINLFDVNPNLLCPR